MTQQIEYFIEKVKKEKGIVGVILHEEKTSKISRKCDDRIVEIFVDTKYYKIWGKNNFVSFIHTLSDRFNIIVRVFDFRQENYKRWKPDTVWERTRGFIIYQIGENLTKLISERKINTEKEIKQILTHVLYDIDWYIALSKIWIERGDLYSSYYMTNIAIENLIKGLFLLNKRLYPPRRYWMHFIGELPWIPLNFTDKLNHILNIQSIDREAILSRGRIIYELYQQYIEKILQNLHKYARPLKFFNLFWLYLFLFIYFQKEVQITTIKKIGKEHYLTSMPLFLLIKRERKQDGIYVSIDKEKMERIAIKGDSCIPKSVEQELVHIWKKLMYKEVVAELKEYFQDISSVSSLPLI